MFQLDEMERVRFGVQLSVEEVRTLLDRFDDAFYPPLSLDVDLDSYSRKLSSNAKFVIADIPSDKDNEIEGFISYYLNNEGGFCYVSLIAVFHSYLHKGIGRCMFDSLLYSLGSHYDCVRLEVLKTNKVAQSFYDRLGFKQIEDHGKKFLLQLNM